MELLATAGAPTPGRPGPLLVTAGRRRYAAWLAAATLLLAACAGPSSPPRAPADTRTPGGVPIDTTHTAQGQDSRVLFLILHYTVADRALSLKVLTGPEVSAHYLVTDETPPRIHRLVDESRRAWHAGVSGWKGHRMLNASSIGIEIVHPGVRQDAQGRRVFPPFAPAQIDALIPLVRDIVARHRIRPERVLGHGEVSPLSKEDPGPAFPWRRLAAAGLAAPWPDAARVAAARACFEASPPDVRWWQDALARHGHPLEPSGQWDEATQRVLMNFQMRWRPDVHDGRPDAESAALLHALVAPEAATDGMRARPRPGPGGSGAPGPATADNAAAMDCHALAPAAR